MEQHTNDRTRSTSRSSTIDRIMRRIVMPLVFLTGAYGLIRYVIIGG